MKKLFIFAICVCQVVMPLTVYSQISQNIKPFTELQELSGARQRHSWKVKVFSNNHKIDNNNEQEKVQKLKQDNKIQVEPYGTGIDVNIDVIKEAEISMLPDGGKLYLLEVGSENAYGMQLHFSKYDVPEGATLHIYDPSRQTVLGAYTHSNINVDARFAIEIVKGDKLILEYFEPSEIKTKSVLKIDRIIHVFTEVPFIEERSGEGGYGTAGTCTVNINCDPAYVEYAKAVSRITFFDPSINMGVFASGALINSTSKKPYMLTANHIFPSGQANQHLSTWIFYFNYEHPNCFAGNNEPLHKTTQGAYIRSKGTKSDYLLLELTSNPKDLYQVSYLGWDAGAYVPDEVVSIHHPSGDVKKISYSFTEPPVTTHVKHPGFIEIPTGFPDHHLKLDWDEGVTGKGASGGPLLDMNTRKIVGQLAGGYSSCYRTVTGVEYPGPDYYGRLYYSWTNPDDGFQPLYTFLSGSAIDNAMDGDFTQSGGFVRINGISMTSDHWEDGVKLVPQVSNTPSAGTLSYFWAPANDFFNPQEAVGILFFEGQKPNLPLTKTYTLTVTSSAGFSATRQVTVTIWDCANKTIPVNICAGEPTPIGYPSKTGETYQWSPATDLSASNVSNPSLSIVTPGQYSYNLITTSEECVRNETYQVTAFGQFEKPTFTPQRVADVVIGGGSGGEILKVIKINGQLGLAAWSKHANAGYHVNETKFTPNYEEFTFNFLNYDLQQIKGFNEEFYYGASQDFDDFGSSFFFIYPPKLRKTDLNGNTLWVKNIWTGSNWPYRHKVEAKSDGGVFYCFEKCVYSVDANGNSLGSRCFNSYLIDIKKTADGGILVIFDEPASHGVHLTKLNSSFQVQWDKMVNVPEMFSLRIFKVNNIATTYDGGFVLGGEVTSNSIDPDIPWNYDYCIIKIDAGGNKLWERKIGEKEVDHISVVKETLDHGLIIGGTSYSDAGVYKSENSRGGGDYWILKLDEFGFLKGDKTIGGRKYDNLVDIVQIDAKTYVLAGVSSSGVGHEKTQANYSGDENFWLVKLVDDPNLPPGDIPEEYQICTSFASDYNNIADPIMEDRMVVGNCSTSVVVNSGAAVYAKAPLYAHFKPGVWIKPGSHFEIKAGSLLSHPCGTENGRTRTNRLVEQSADADSVSFLQEASRISIVPNPTTGRAWVVFNADAKPPLKVSVFNTMGQIVKEEIVNDVQTRYEVDLSSYSAGVFVISVQADSGIITSKLLKH
jgi:hypothetical protein